MDQTYRQGDEPVPGSGYRLERFLGRGGFGEVWKAAAPGGAEAALKLIALGGLEGRKELRALQLMKRIRHPNLVPIVAFWLKSSDGTVLDETLALQSFLSPPADPRATAMAQPMGDSACPLSLEPTQLVMAMGLGDKSLLDRLKECRDQNLPGIPQDELLDYMDDAAEAIDFLNRRIHGPPSNPIAIQHCDIKPHNMMIVGGALQLCDFGLARMLGSDRTTNVAATVAYAAPECLVRGLPSETTDQYSLAVTYYELRTGELPYVNATLAAVLDAKRQGTLDLSKVSPGEQTALRRATEPNPEDRFSSSREMVQALRRACGADSETDNTRAHHHPWRMPIAVTVLLAVIVTAIGLITIWRQRPTPTVVRHDASTLGTSPLAHATTQPPPVTPRPSTEKQTTVTPAKMPVSTGEPSKMPAEADKPPQLASISQTPTAAAESTKKLMPAGEPSKKPLEATESTKKLMPTGEPSKKLPEVDESSKKPPMAADAGSPHLTRGTEFLVAKDYDKAIAEFTAAALANGSDPRVFSRRGIAHTRKKDFAAAIADFTTAIRLDPDARDYVNRGNARLELADYAQAGADYTEAIKLAPQDGWTYYLRGSAWAAQEQVDKAIADLTQAIRLDVPDPSQVYDRRADCFQEAGRPAYAKFDRRVASLFNELAQNASDVEILRRLAEALATCPQSELRDGKKALELALRACELTTNHNAACLGSAAAAHAELGQFAEAVRLSKQAIELATPQTLALYRARLASYEKGHPLYDPDLLTP